MKKRVALLAMAAMLALTPVAAFAATDNNVDKVVTVADDAKLYEGDAPVLKIENDSTDMKTADTIELTLENAEWLDDAVVEDDDLFEATITNAVYAAFGNATKVDVDKSDTKLKIRYENATLTDTTLLRLPLLVEMDGSQAKVTVGSKSGAISEDTITFANGADGDVVIELDDTITFSEDEVLPTINISETIAGSIDVSDFDDEYISLTVDADFNLGVVADAGLKTSGAYVKGDFIDDTVAGQSNGKVMLVEGDNCEIDDNELKIYFGAVTADAAKPIQLKTDEAVRYDFDIVDVTIDAGSKADEGDLEVKVKSSISEIGSKTFDLGTYAQYDVTVEADDDPNELIAARFDNGDEDVHLLQTLNIEEEVAGAMNQGKYVTVELPEDVRVISVEVDGATAAQNNTIDIDENEFELKPETFTASGDVDMSLDIQVSVKAGFTGDIVAKVEGNAFEEEYEVVLGKAVAPVEIEAEVAPLKAGVRDQEIGKITITETAEEMLEEGKLVVIELSDDDMEWDGEPTIEVVKGDLEIDEDTIEIDPFDNGDDHILAFEIKEESSEASVIEITNADVELDRSISEGAIEVEVKGSALVQNDEDSVKAVLGLSDAPEYAFSSDEYATLEVANVITPADENTQAAAEAKFVIGQAEFMMGENVVVADVAPYIKDGRTMLSLSFVAKALGVEANNIMWDGQSRTVTIFKGDRIAQVQIGSNKLMVNGTPVMMDTNAEIKEGRTMLPVAYVAKALGAEVAWDGATKTVTIK